MPKEMQERLATFLKSETNKVFEAQIVANQKQIDAQMQKMDEMVESYKKECDKIVFGFCNESYKVFEAEIVARYRKNFEKFIVDCNQSNEKCEDKGEDLCAKFKKDGIQILQDYLNYHENTTSNELLNKMMNKMMARFAKIAEEITAKHRS